MTKRIAPRARFSASWAGGVIALISITSLAMGGVSTNDPSGGAFAAPSRATEALSLLGQDPYTVSGGELNLEVSISSSLSEPTDNVVITAQSSITNRAAFTRVVNGTNTGSVLDQVEIALAALPSPGGSARAISLTLGAAGALALPALSAPGVYPLAIALEQANGQVRESFTTFAVVVEGGLFASPVNNEPRLAVAWVWPLVAGPAELPNGSADPVVSAAALPTGRLGRQVSALSRHLDIPITISPGPETVTARNTSPLRSGLLAVAARAQVLAGPYVPVDIPSLIENLLGGIADNELATGNTALSEYFSSPPDIRTALANPVSPSALTLLRARGTTRVAISNSALVNGSRSVPTAPFSLKITPPAGVDETTISAVASDDGIANLLTGASPVLSGQRVLAALALNAYASEGATQGTVLVNPFDLDIPEETFSTILNGLRNHPLLKPVTLESFFSEVPAVQTSTGALEIRELTTYSPPAPPVKASALNATANRVLALQAFIGSDAREVRTANQWLLRAPSATFTEAAGQARARRSLKDAQARVTAALAQIEIPNPGTITLTSENGSIPLTFRNNFDQTVRVRISLASEKLSFPTGSTQELELPPANTTVRIPVQARTPGTFVLRLNVASSDGLLIIAVQEFKVRSTAVSAIGIILMIGAVVVLAAWWILDARARRKKRREKTAVPA